MGRENLKEDDIRVHLVGGAVRDWLLGRKPREYDFVFEGESRAFLQRNPSARKVGKSISVILLDGQEYMPVKGDLATDLLARDLTINAFALESNGIIHACPGAFHDISASILRPVTDRSFFEEPVRVFRLARMACELPSFRVHPDGIAQMRAVAATSLLRTIPVERINREFLKALAAPCPSRWLRILYDGDCLRPWFAPFLRTDEIPAGPSGSHTGSVLRHLMEVMDLLSGDPLRVWMGLCHDLGKARTPANILPHHYRHEQRGIFLSHWLGTKLSLPSRMIAAGEVAAGFHMQAGIYPQLRTGTRCRLLHRVHAAGFDEPFWALVDADSGSSFSLRAFSDLQTMLSVTLPPQWHNRGAASGQHLHELRCQALRERKENAD